MYIEPNTTIHVLKNVPLDTTYDHTIYFDNAIQQHAYFISKIKYTYSNQTYQRVKRGWVRLRQNANELYDCNYIMFQNTAYGAKWFYAFIKSVEYINDSVAEIEFEIDVMQTWFFDYQREQCFVIREHSATDRIGDNLVPETLELGDYVSDHINGTGIMRDWVIVVCKTATAVGIPVTGGFYGRTYNQCEFDIYEPTAEGIASLRTWITGVSIFDNVNIILGIYMMPRGLVYTKAGSLGVVSPITFTHSEQKSYASIDGYVPKNNKLFTHPYNFLKVSNLQGDTKEYHYEYFAGDNCDFLVGCDTTVDPCIVLMPDAYKGLPNTNPNERMVLKNFPKCGYATNDFGAKLVQAGIWAALTVATSGSATPLVTTVTENQTNVERIGRGPQHKTSAQTVRTIEQTGGTDPNASVLRAVGIKMLHPHVSNVSGDSGALHNLGYLDFVFENMHIRREFAEIIDDYFNCYGYATNRVKVPNINARPHWSYVKTANCTIKGSIPCDDAKAICIIYNNGITFWKNGDEIGNYTLDNRPIN